MEISFAISLMPVYSFRCLVTKKTLMRKNSWNIVCIQYPKAVVQSCNFDAPTYSTRPARKPPSSEFSKINHLFVIYLFHKDQIDTLFPEPQQPNYCFLLSNFSALVIFLPTALFLPSAILLSCLFNGVSLQFTNFFSSRLNSLIILCLSSNLTA